MFVVEKPCFLLVATPSNKRLLKAGRVIERGDDGIVVEFEEMLLPPVSTEVILLAELRGKFWQQAARVTAHRADETNPDLSKPTAEFQTIGEPVSAEQRGTFRVSIISAQIPARVGKCPKSVVADVSPEGLSVISAPNLLIGSSVDVTFTAEGVVVSGSFKVQSAKPISPSRTRYGLYAPEKTSSARQALEKLSGVMQRHQLKRLAGAA